MFPVAIVVDLVAGLEFLLFRQLLLLWNRHSLLVDAAVAAWRTTAQNLFAATTMTTAPVAVASVVLADSPYSYTFLLFSFGCYAPKN